MLLMVFSSTLPTAFPAALSPGASAFATLPGGGLKAHLMRLQACTMFLLQRGFVFTMLVEEHKSCLACKCLECCRKRHGHHVQDKWSGEDRLLMM